MDKFYIDIKGKWAIVFAYNINEDDITEVSGWLKALGAKRKDIDKACRIAMSTNCGFTFSNDELRMSVTAISNASSEEQWWNTCVHEIDHIQAAICKYYDVDLGTEEAAYLQGYLMLKVLRGIKD